MIILPLNVGFSALAAGRPDSVSGTSSVRTGSRLFCASASATTASAAISNRPENARFIVSCDAIGALTIPPVSAPHLPLRSPCAWCAQKLNEVG
jgi:hypothetical protein